MTRRKGDAVDGRRATRTASATITAALVVALALPAGAVVPTWPAPTDWQVTTVVDQWGASWDSLAMYEGKPRILTQGGRDNEGLGFASCDLDCENPANWTHTVLVNGTTVRMAALAVDPAGRAHAAYHDWDDRFAYLNYLTCAASCHNPGSWQHARLATVVDTDHPLLNASPPSSLLNIKLAVTDDGRPRLAYGTRMHGLPPTQANRALGYGECDADCANPDAWEHRILGSSLDPGLPGDRDEWHTSVRQGFELVLEEDRPRIAFSLRVGPDSAGNVRNLPVRFASCEQDCLDEASWTAGEVRSLRRTLAHPLGFAIDDDGRRHLVYVDGLATTQPSQTNLWYGVDVLWYSTCAQDCHSETGWSAPIPLNVASTANGNVRWLSNVRLVTAGSRPRVLYTEFHPQAHPAGRNDIAGHPFLALCDEACDSPAQWRDQPLSGQLGQWMVPGSLATDGDRLRIAYRHSGELVDEVRYAWCDDACGQPTP